MMCKFIVLLKWLIFLCLANSQIFAVTPSDTMKASPKALELIKNLQLRENSVASRDYSNWQTPKQISVIIPAQFKPIAKSLIGSLQQAAPDVTINTYYPASNTKPPEFLKESEVIFGNCNKDLLDQIPNAIWIQHFSSGVEGCAASARTSHPKILLTNIQHIAAPAIAEHAISLMLMLTRNLDNYYRLQLDNKWQRILTAGDNEVGGKTLLVLGLGGIGNEVAKRAHGLGMRVIATRNSSRRGPNYVEKVGLADEIYEFAKQADIIVNALPSTDKTKSIINETFFSAMKKGGIYISVGRGTTTNLDDLVNALKSGKIIGAGLDVTDPEPLPQSHPLWTMDNVIITPHIAGFSTASIRRSFILYQENLRRYIQGEKLLNVVDIERGY
jgi:phosphoglycerate dehydrogenase-like enzyme